MIVSVLLSPKFTSTPSIGTNKSCSVPVWIMFADFEVTLHILLGLVTKVTNYTPFQCSVISIVLV